MRYKGINYDIGTRTTTGTITREKFDCEIVRKEIEIIKNDLHCNAIRISGLDIDRIVMASEIALQNGLTVWFSPALHYENQENTRKYILSAAIEAEKLRSKYSNLVFVAGCELTIFTGGFVKGKTGNERLKKIFSPISILMHVVGLKRAYNKKLNKFLSELVAEIKQHFRGQISYASGNWEKVDWRIFDFAAVDLYRSSFNKSIYNKELEGYTMLEKPLCIMEFGCCAYKGAEEKGAMGWNIIDWKKNPPELTGEHIRDEEVQAKYLLELLEIFENKKVDGAFVFTFVTYNYRYNSDPRYDLDMGSFGIVRSLPDTIDGYAKNLTWMPKQAFFDLGEYYKGH